MKILQIIFQTCLVFIVITIIAGIVLSVYPFQEYEIKTQPYRVVEKQVKAGKPLRYEVDYCKLSNASGRITLIWEGPSRVVVDLGTFQANKSCVKTTLIVPVPVDLLPGQYQLHGHGEYPKWLVGKAKVDTYTEYFEVIE